MSLGVSDSNEGVTLHVLFMFEYIALTIRDKLELEELPQEPLSQLRRVLTEVIIIDYKDIKE